jgi:hypothetical protein
MWSELPFPLKRAILYAKPARGAAMSFNRPVFEAYVATHSPLSSFQLDRLFGTVDAANKRLVWDFLKWPGKDQAEAFARVMEVRKHFPEAVVMGVR